MCFFLLFFLRPSSPSRLTAEAAPDDLSSSSPYSTSSSSAMKFLSYKNASLMRVFGSYLFVLLIVVFLVLVLIVI
jgi:hypothetical protein